MKPINCKSSPKLFDKNCRTYSKQALLFKFFLRRNVIVNEIKSTNKLFYQNLAKQFFDNDCFRKTKHDATRILRFFFDNLKSVLPENKGFLNRGNIFMVRLEVMRIMKKNPYPTVQKERPQFIYERMTKIHRIFQVIISGSTNRVFW